MKNLRYDQTAAAAGGGVSNKLLAALPEADREVFLAGTRLVDLAPRQVLHRAGTPLRHAYFPLSGAISLLMPSNGKAVEIAMIGNEGMHGLPLFFGGTEGPMTALSLARGQALRVTADFFWARVRESAPLAAILGRYAQAFTVALAQGVVCSNQHPIEQRLAKWLLMAHDRMGQDEFPLTHEGLAQLLGARRSSVSEVAKGIQERGLIRYTKGRVTILDRAGLEDLSCDCYRVTRREFDRVVPSRHRQR